MMDEVRKHAARWRPVRLVRWLLPFGIWYVLAAWGALEVAAYGLLGNPVGTAEYAVLTLAVGVPAFLYQRRWRRSGEKPLRAELARLVKERLGTGPWLNRDEHLVFIPQSSWLQDRTLAVIDEDQVGEAAEVLEAGGGRVAIVTTSFGVLPPLARVMRRTDGSMAEVTEEGVDVDFKGPRLGVRWWRLWADSMRTGRAFADAAELAEVIRQFRDAELLEADA